MAQISVAIAGAHSLKEKRMVIRRMKDRVRERVGVMLAEVGAQDTWQRAELGVAVASGDRGKAIELVDDVVRVVASAGSAGGAEIIAIARDAQTFDAATQPWKPTDAETVERTGAGDKAIALARLGDPPSKDGAQVDADWIPDAWRDEASR